MIKIENKLEGKYAVPENHPVTCLNEAPWQITEMRIEQDSDENNKQFVKVWIRGEKSVWFVANQCFISDKDDCDMFVEMRTQAEALKKAEAMIPNTREEAQQMIELALRNNYTKNAIPVILDNLGYKR